MFGLAESVSSYMKDDIKVNVLQNNEKGYAAAMSIELDDRIVHQVLTILPAATGVYSNSKGMEDLRRCYPRNASEYPEEIQKLEPWEINGNSLQSLYRGIVNILTYDIDFKITEIEPLEGQDLGLEIILCRLYLFSSKSCIKLESMSKSIRGTFIASMV